MVSYTYSFSSVFLTKQKFGKWPLLLQIKEEKYMVNMHTVLYVTVTLM